MIKVYAFFFKAHALEDNKKYFSWNIVDICLFVRDNNESIIEVARSVIKKERWQPITALNSVVVNKERIFNSGEIDVIDTYNQAIDKGYCLKVFSGEWCGFKDSPPILMPRITEAFIDRVIRHAGGDRLKHAADNSIVRNADYLIDNYIFELKIIEEERLFLDSVKNKIADLLYQDSSEEIPISADNLDLEKYRIYRNIFRTPIQNAIKSASQQIKDTRSIISEEHRKGGLIIINNGTSSFTPEMFNDCVKTSLMNNTKEIDSHVAICAWTISKGLESSFYFSIDPKEVEKLDDVQKKIINSFKLIINEFMTEWAREGFRASNTMVPQYPIVFEKYGLTYVKMNDQNF